MLNFEDATVVNLFQAHSFEDRVLKKASLHPSRRTVRSGVTCSMVMGENAVVEPQSVIMKNETLNGGRRYVGAPTQSHWDSRRSIHVSSLAYSANWLGRYRRREPEECLHKFQVRSSYVLGRLVSGGGYGHVVPSIA